MSLPREPEADPPVPRPAPPAPRIGDVERDKAVTSLQEHMAQGRLTAEEFDERLTQALAARTADDLQPLFDDLPEPRPSGLSPSPSFAPPPWSAGAVAIPTPAPPPQPVDPTGSPHMPRGATVAMSLVWPATVLLYILTGFNYWWLFVVAAFVTYGIRRVYPPVEQPPPPDDTAGPPAVGR